MTTEIIAYIGAALMVVLAYLAYRYWRATAAYARRARESHAQRALESYQLAPLATPQVAPEDVEVTGEDETGSAASDQEPAEPDSVDEEPVDPEPVESEMGDEVIGGDGSDIEEVEATPDASHDGTEDAIEELTEKVPTVDDLTERDPELRLIEELEPRPTSTMATSSREISERLKQLDEEIAALPSGVELIDLPIIERRRVADRRQELLNDRADLLAQRKRGAHRQGRRRNRRPRKD